MKRGLRYLARLSLLARRSLRRFVTWWRANDRKYRVKWRVANAAAALLFIFSVALPILQANWRNGRYVLSADTLSLVGKNNQALADKLKYDAQTETYEYNQAAINTQTPPNQGQMQFGGGGKDTKSLYALDVPTDFSKGVTYHDVNSQQSFSLVPQFQSLPGQTEQGRIVFPLDGGPQAVYTLKNNGLKEDIVVAGNKKDSLRFSYKLQLPKTLAAKPLPNGGIGIYGGDPTLFSDMSYGSDSDRALVEKARENADKTNLIFGIPAPSITSRDGKLDGATARFELRGDVLTVVAENLTDIHSAFSLDPSVVVTSTSDFTTNGNDDGNISFSNTDQISRSGPTGGTIGSFGSAANAGTSLFTATGFASTVAYNGYLYGIAGQVSGGTATSAVYYAPICTGPNSNASAGCDSNATAGKLGNWTTTTTYPGSNLDVTNAVAYNGFVYILGGGGNSNSSYANTYYAQICTGSNSGVNGCGSTPGTLGTWNTGSNLYEATAVSQAAVYNGIIYVMGGCTGSGWISSCVRSSTVQYASVRGDGSLSTWTNNGGNTLSVARHRGAAVAYNGRMYIIGGCTNGSYANCTSGIARATDTQYATINADGSISATWTTAASSFANSSLETEAAVYKGYLYYFTYSGVGGTTSTHYTQYAPIYANGSIGPISSTTNYTGIGRQNSGTLVYNGYEYIIGGCTASSCNATTNDVQVSKVDVAGVTTPNTTSATYDTAGTMSFGSVAYNGYLYVIGGTTDSAGGDSTQRNTARYAKVNADGTLGTWATSSTHFINSVGTGNCVGANLECSGRLNPAVTAYNGYIYLAGGVSNGNSIYWSDVQSARVCTGANTPVSGCAGAGDLVSWTTVSGDFVTNGSYTNTDGRAQIGLVAYNGTLYIVGGHGPGTPGSDYATIYYAAINANGTLGSFSSTTQSLPANRAGLNIFVDRGRLYIVGGGTSESGWAYANPQTDADDVQFIPICTAAGAPAAGCTKAGDLAGSWVDANASANGGSGSSFTAAGNLANYGVAIVNDYLYISGGQNGSGQTNTIATVKFAHINSNGSLGSWVTTNSIDTRYGHAYLASNGYLYAIGGCSNRASLIGNNCANNASIINDWQGAQANDGGNGNNPAWSTLGTFTTFRSQAATVAYNGYIYVTGGCTSLLAVTQNGCASDTTDIQYGSINADGTITWKGSTTNALPTARYGHAAVAYNGYLYVIGGFGTGGNFGTSFLQDVEKALICTGSNSGVGGCGTTAGDVGTWSSTGAGANIPTARADLSAFAYNGYLYIAGGCSAQASSNCTGFQNDVRSAPLAADGSVGSWSSAYTFTTGRFAQNMTTYGGYIYVIGGCSAMASNSCTTFQNDVQYAPLTNGVVGSWSYANGLNGGGRYGASITAYDGYMYVIGGCEANSSGNCSQFEAATSYAPILSGGGIGAWTAASNTYATPRMWHGSVVANGRLYIAGGMDSGANLKNDSQNTALQVLPRTALYSKLLDLGRSINVRSITYNTASDAVTVSYRYATSTAAFTSQTPASASAVAPTGTCTGNAQQAHYLQLIVAVDDSNTASYGETTGSAITDLTVSFYYTHPTPQIRLRGGQQLQVGELTPLDTCGSMSPI